MNSQDPLQYIKDIQALSWKDLGYSTNMTRILGGEQNQAFLGGADMDSYFEDGGFQGTKISNISANRIVTSILEATVDVGTGAKNAYVRLDGSNNRIIINDGTDDRILIGFQSGGF